MAFAKILMKRFLASQTNYHPNIGNFPRSGIFNCILLKQIISPRRCLATQSEINPDDNQINPNNTNINSKDSSTGNRKWQIAAVAGVGVALAGAWYYSKSKGEKLSPHGVLATTLKRGLLATRKGQLEEAQQLFHQGLELAHQQLKQNVIDDNMMAANAIKAGDFGNAEKLYKETMQKCIAAGRAQDDESVVELSIKLASLYAMMSRDEEAETGFKFCIKVMNEKVKEAGGLLQSDTNTLALKGLAIQSYARFLMKKKQHLEAIRLYKESLDIAREVYGADHPQALVVLNDLASAHIMSRQYKEGILAYEEAVTRAEKSEASTDSLVAFYYNLGEACILNSDFKAARAYCTKCSEIADKIGDPSLIQAGKHCLRDVSEVEEKEKAKSNNT